MKTVMKTSMLSLLLATSFAFAADLPTAKKQGLIGEQNNGYLGLVNNQAPAETPAEEAVAPEATEATEA